MRYHDSVIETGARLLSQARIRRTRLAELPAPVRPKTTDEAYDCQAFMVRQLVEHYGGSIIGYKIACTSDNAQQQLHVDGPFSGYLVSAFSFDSPARVDADPYYMRVVEAEFGFRMAQDLPPISRPREREEVAAAVEGVVPSIEIVDSRFESWTTIGALSLIADNACNAAWVKGEMLTDWRGIDLAAQTVRVTVNGKVVREGSGSAVLGHPLNALLWLANSLNSRGAGLRARQYVTTGVTTEVYMGEVGDRITADFGPVGSAELVFVSGSEG
jgi:2-keto-4-pentenoate hydratase